ncbi:MAG: Uma2 family endonuclease [Chloroflexota bacterium]
MVLETQQMTAAQFDAFVQRPENREKLFEFISGEVVAVQSSPYTSYLASCVLASLVDFVQINNYGHVTGQGGVYVIHTDRYIPDGAFISYEKQPELAREGYNPNPPDLAVEVISSDTAAEHAALRIKISGYHAVGTVVWVVYPEEKRIEVHEPGKKAAIYREKDTVPGVGMLAGFELTVADIFS